jgi:hypothetical protein
MTRDPVSRARYLGILDLTDAHAAIRFKVEGG